MDRAQRHTRGGNADGPRKAPKSEHEDKEEKILQDELDDSFPASDPPSWTGVTGPGDVDKKSRRK